MSFVSTRADADLKRLKFSVPQGKTFCDVVPMALVRPSVKHVPASSPPKATVTLRGQTPKELVRHASAHSPFSMYRKFSHDAMPFASTRADADLQRLKFSVPQGPVFCDVVPVAIVRPSVEHVPAACLESTEGNRDTAWADAQRTFQACINALAIHDLPKLSHDAMSFASTRADADLKRLKFGIPQGPVLCDMVPTNPRSSACLLRANRSSRDTAWADGQRTFQACISALAILDLPEVLAEGNAPCLDKSRR